MKHIKRKVTLLLSSFMLVSCAGEVTDAIGEILENKDDYVYQTNIKKDFLKPDIRFADDEDDEEDEIGEVDKVILHYVNDDNKCLERAFYVWVPGVDGVEYSSKGASDIVKYGDPDQGFDENGLMTIEMDLKNDARFTSFFGSTSLMYIIKYQMISPSNLNWGGQSEDVELKYADFPPVNGVVEVWCTPAAGGGIAQFATKEETQVDGVKIANFVDFKTIQCSLTSTSGTVDWQLYAFDETYYKVKSKNRAAIKRNYLVKEGQTSSKDFTINLKYNAHLNIVYSIVSKDIDSITGLEKTIFVSFEKLYYTQRFEDKYNYTGDDLGVTYTPTETTFKVWSPVAANITLLVYKSDTSAAYEGDDKYTGYHMIYQKNGIWALTLVGDLDGYYYNYSVDTWAGSSVTMDPYATGAGACGVRGLIYDKKGAKVTPEGFAGIAGKWDGTSRDIKTPQELTIYEVHIQDFTGDQTWISNKGNARGTYNAFVESGTTYTENDKTVTTGYDHLKDLGIGAVQLMPVFDSDNDEVKNKKYNWGYNPLNYNCVEGAYSSDPHNGYARIYEFRNLVLQLAKINVRVIMDVVYNHVSSPSASCFNKLMPRYFFRYDENGELYDGSGCHNEFRSEATMARKYIVDSVSMWAKDYAIKGFRFDLMGLIDTGTMKAVKLALGKIDKDIYLYGEGWTAGGYHGGIDAATGQQSKGSFCSSWSGNEVYSLLNNTEDDECYLGGFNDFGRNKLRGENDSNGTKYPGSGFMQTLEPYEEQRQAITAMVYGIHGKIADGDVGWNPKQTINYASCHDNWTLRDQLYQTLGNDGAAGNGYDVMHASEVAHALVFASNGVAFMLGGEELLRTKDDEFCSEEDFAKIKPDTYEYLYGHPVAHNSYDSPLETNSFKWSNKIYVTFDYMNGSEKYLVDTYAENLTGKFANMIKLHKEIMTKYDLDGIQSIMSTTSKGNKVDNLSWHSRNGEGGFGVQFDEYFIYVSGRYYKEVGAGSISKWGAPILKTGGDVSHDANNIKLGNSGYGNGFALAIYDAKGKR